MKLKIFLITMLIFYCCFSSSLASPQHHNQSLLFPYLNIELKDLHEKRDPSLWRNSKSLVKGREKSVADAIKERGTKHLPPPDTIRVTKILDNGSPATHVDLVILSDGFQAHEMQKFRDAVDKMLFGFFYDKKGANERYRKGFFEHAPLDTYQRFFNVWRIELISDDSGIDHRPAKDAGPDYQVYYKKTALDSHFGCEGMERLLCSRTDVIRAIANHYLPKHADDNFMVVANDEMYGGGGAIYYLGEDDDGESIYLDALDPDIGYSDYNMTSINPYWLTFLFTHETGHGFGKLADEYAYEETDCVPDDEPFEKNVTLCTHPASVKWTHWIDDFINLPVPTPPDFGNGSTTPGLFESAYYCPYEVYRSTNLSVMGTFVEFFGPVNSELLIEQIYTRANGPITGFSPDLSGTVILSNHGNKQQVFTVSHHATQPKNTVSVEWFLDHHSMGKGEPLQINGKKGSRLTLAVGDMDAGTHTLKVMVTDNTLFVRNPSLIENLLKRSMVWTVIRKD